LCIWNFAS